jgi:hypothetical protein
MLSAVGIYSITLTITLYTKSSYRVVFGRINILYKVLGKPLRVIKNY